MSIALDPTIGTQWSDHYVDVETQSDLTRGMTVVDRLNVADDERNHAVWSACPAEERQNESVLDNRQLSLEASSLQGPAIAKQPSVVNVERVPFHESG